MKNKIDAAIELYIDLAAMHIALRSKDRSDRSLQLAAKAAVRDALQTDRTTMFMYLEHYGYRWSEEKQKWVETKRFYKT